MALTLIYSPAFGAWMANLADHDLRAIIETRLDRMTQGNFGDSKPLRDGVQEARIHHGPGYRLYYARRGPVIVLLLAGGAKRTQKRDIEAALALLDSLKGV